MWAELSDADFLSEIVSIRSHDIPQILFKHSTRCPVSFTAKKMFELEWDNSKSADLFLLDLIKFREVSNLIAETLQVHHESPQVIVVSKGRVLYHASHSSISASEVLSVI